MHFVFVCLSVGISFIFAQVHFVWCWCWDDENSEQVSLYQIYEKSDVDEFIGIRYKYTCTQTILFSPTKRCHFLCCHSWRFLRQLCHFQNSYKMTWLEERFMVVLECIFVTALLFKICRCCHGNRSCCSLTCFIIMFFTLVLIISCWYWSTFIINQPKWACFIMHICVW